ncbi:hypothetical protein PCK1_001050 [Pneumocystis canis]|nr:hypothetical protein PCK1_001050 [Pneumocystis canis]
MCQWVKSMVNHKEDGRHTLMGAFSQALVNFGEKFSSDSTYGLMKYGMAHKDISDAQETLIASMSNTVLNSLERSLVQFKDYQAARKKLENRRLSYESVSNRFPKAKKEDSRIEEELRAAKAKYEEACENIYNRIYMIQQAEATQLIVIACFEGARKERLEGKIKTLEVTFNELVNKQERLQATLKNPDASSTVKQHISLLHQYNEIRDVALGLIGKIADQERCRVIDVMERFGINKDD